MQKTSRHATFSLSLPYEINNKKKGERHEYNHIGINTKRTDSGNLRLKYDILKGLSLQIRSGLDVYSDKRTMRHAVTSQSFFNGYYQEDDVSFMPMNNDSP